jgi:hypothetical protein
MYLYCDFVAESADVPNGCQDREYVVTQGVVACFVALLLWTLQCGPFKGYIYCDEIADP